MKTGHMAYDMTMGGVVSIDTEDAIIINSDSGIYNVIAKKPMLGNDGEVCGTLYVHAPNCTLENGNFVMHPANEDRTTITYHQLCDLAHVPYKTSCCDLFKALNKIMYSVGYKPNLNRAVNELREVKNDKSIS